MPCSYNNLVKKGVVGKVDIKTLYPMDVEELR